MCFINNFCVSFFLVKLTLLVNILRKKKYFLTKLPKYLYKYFKISKPLKYFLYLKIFFCQMTHWVTPNASPKFGVNLINCAKVNKKIFGALIIKYDKKHFLHKNKIIYTTQIIN